MATATLYYLEQEIELKKLEFTYYKHTKKNGKPKSQPLGGMLDVVADVSETTLRCLEQLLYLQKEWGNPHSNITIDHQDILKPATVKVLDSDGYTLRTYDFIDLHIKKYKQKSTHTNQINTNFSTEVHMRLASAAQRINGEVINVFEWIYSPYTHWLNETHQTPVVATEEKKEPYARIEFTASKKDLENGVFGFDAMENAYKNNVTNYAKLKKAYTPIQVENEEYFVPWLSIQQGQTVTLKIDKNKIKEYQHIGAKAEGFTIQPSKINKSTKELQITCNTSLSEATQLKFYADDDTNKLAGAINVWQNQRKTIHLRWVFVEMHGKMRDKTDLEGKITREQLKDYLKKAFNPAMIDVVLVNNTPDILNIHAIENYVMPTENKTDKDLHMERLQNITEDIKKCFVTGTNDAIKTDESTRSALLRKLYYTYTQEKIYNKQNIAPDDVVLFITNLKVITQTKEGVPAYNNGISHTGAGQSLLFTKNYGLDPNNNLSQIKGDVPHEVMHAIGLQHTFPENPTKDTGKEHTFRLGSTNNYMDYQNTKKTTFVWQWEQLFNSKYAK